LAFKAPVGGNGFPIGVAQEPFDLASLAHDKASVAPFDQRGAAEQQAIRGAGEAEIVLVAVFAETPDPKNHFILQSGTYASSGDNCQLKCDYCRFSGYERQPSRPARTGLIAAQKAYIHLA
jgi:hypothetical protein